MSWPVELGGRGLSRLTATLVEEVLRLPLAAALVLPALVQDDRRRDRALRLARARRAAAAADRARRARLLPGLLGAGRGQRSRLADDAGRAARRHLRRDRPQDLDLERAPRRLDLPRRAHRPRTPSTAASRCSCARSTRPGIEVRTFPTLGGGYLCETFLDGVEIPAANLVGDGQRRLGRAHVHARLRARDGGEGRRRRLGARRGRGAAARDGSARPGGRDAAAPPAGRARGGAAALVPRRRHCSIAASRAARPRRWRSWPARG